MRFYTYILLGSIFFSFIVMMFAPNSLVCQKEVAQGKENEVEKRPAR